MQNLKNVNWHLPRSLDITQNLVIRNKTSNELFFQLFEVNAQKERDSDVLQCSK